MRLQQAVPVIFGKLKRGGSMASGTLDATGAYIVAVTTGLSNEILQQKWRRTRLECLDQEEEVPWKSTTTRRVLPTALGSARACALELFAFSTNACLACFLASGSQPVA